MFVDGKAVAPRWVYPARCRYFLATGPEAKRHDVEFAVLGSNATLRISFRYNEILRGKERATTTLRDIRLVEVATGREVGLGGRWTAVQKDEWTGTATFGKDGSVVAELRPARETHAYGDFHVTAEARAFAPGKYRLSFEAVSTSPQPLYPTVRETSARRNGSVALGEGDFYDRTIRCAAAAGVNVITPPMPNCWTDPSRPVDWGPLDAAMRHLVDVNPKAVIVPRVGVDAPAWFLKAHPEVRMKDENGTVLSKGSVSSRPYRKLAVEHVERLARHLREAFPRHFGGLHVCGQNTGEWFYYNSFGPLLGYEDCVRDAFREYLAARGDPSAATAEVPTPAERRAPASGCFVDPTRQTRVAAFNEFRQLEIATFLDELGAAIRRGTDGRLLSVFFYGYLWELAGSGAESGHLGLGWLLEHGRGNFDAFAGPISYPGRQKWPGFRNVMCPAETMARAGVMWIHEDDTRTYLEPFWDFITCCGGPKVDKAQTLRTLRRNLAQDIIRGFGCWWMDLFGRGWLVDPDLWNVQGELRGLENAMMNRKGPFAPDIAFIAHEKGLESLVASRRTFLAPALSSARDAFSGAGAPYGQYLLTDVLANGLDAKLRYYASAYHLTKAQRAALVADRKAHPERTRVWVWAPGYVSPEGCGIRQVEETTGFELADFGSAKKRPLDVIPTARGRACGLSAANWPVKHDLPVETLFTVRTNAADEVWATYPGGEPAVVVRRHREGGADVFVSPFRIPDASFVAALGRLAGVHLYTRPGEAAVWAAEDRVMAQALKEGPLTVDFGVKGAVLDSSSGERVANGPVATLPFGLGDVRVFRVSDRPLVARKPALSSGQMPRKGRLHIYLLMGQSNMAGRGLLTKENALPSNPRLLMFDENGEWKVAEEPLHADKGSAGAGLGMSFGLNMTESGPIHRVGLVPCAVGGSPLARWMPGGDLYANALARAREAMKSGRLTGILWHQGEANAGSAADASTYAARLVETLTQFRKDLGQGDVRIALGELGPYLEKWEAKHDSIHHWRTINAQLREAAAKLPNCRVVSAEGLGCNPDLLHFDTASLRTFGERYADALKGAVDATVTSVASPIRAFAGGRELKVNAARVSAFPMNQEWPGYQRPLDQTKIDFFTSFPVEGPVDLSVEIPGGVPRDLRIRPLGATHETRAEGGRLVVRVTKPEQFVIECGKGGPALHVFADPPFRHEPVADEIHFGPGEHDVGVVAPRSGQTVCIDEGAVVYGAIYCYRVKDVRITGRGIVDASRLHRGDRRSKAWQHVEGLGLDSDAKARSACCFTALASTNVTVEGVVMRDSCRWTMLVRNGSEGITFDNVKVIGQWRYCSDGLDVWNAGGVTLRNSFIRSFDDCVVARGPVHDFRVDNCVLWCDWGKNIVVCTDGAPLVNERISFSNCALAEVSGTACSITVWDSRGGGEFRDIRFENLEVDFPRPRWRPQLQRLQGERFEPVEQARGVVADVSAHPNRDAKGAYLPPIPGKRMRLRDVVFDGIRVYGEETNRVAVVNERTASYDFSGVTFRNMDPTVRIVGAADGKSDAERMHATEMNAGIPASREILRGGEFRVLVYGNSIAHHRPSAKIGWTNSWGMAASSLDRDFASLTVKGLEERLGKKADYRVKTLYRLECDPRAFDVEKTLADDVAFRPDYVVIAIGENVKSLDTDEKRDVYRTRLEEIARMFRKDGRNPKIVYRSPFWRNELKARLTKEAAEATGSLYVDAGPLGDDPANKALGLFEHPGVAGHPGDLGMRRLADLILGALSDRGPAAEAKVYEFPPVPWGETTVEREAERVLVKDKAGKVLLRIETEGGREHIRDVSVKVGDGVLLIDPRKAFAAGSGKVVAVSCDYEAPELAGGLVDMEMSWTAPSGGGERPKVQMFMTGNGADGKWFALRGTDARITSVLEAKPVATRGRTAPESVKRMQFRFDVIAGGPAGLAGGRIAPKGAIPLPKRKPDPVFGEPELLLDLPFDGTAEAASAKGNPKPLRAEGLEFAPGVKGRAVRLTAEAKSVLEYAFEGNANREHGSVAMWVKRERKGGRFLFTSGRPFDEARFGTGALYLWLHGEKLRADIGDDDDRYLTVTAPAVGEWHHVVLSWTGSRGGMVFVDGEAVKSAGDRYSPIAEMYHPYDYGNFGGRNAFARITIGGNRDGQLEGLLDEVKVYSVPLSEEAVRKLYLRERPHAPKPIDYPALAAKGGNPYVGPSRAVAGQPGERELVKEIVFDRLPPAELFRTVGACRVGELGGVRYVEAGRRENDRFAVALDLDMAEPFYWLEIDYPDDCKRTMDLLVQETKLRGNDYTLGVGVMCGGEYANTGRIRTHRCILWTRSPKVAVEFMTARRDAPAAVSAIRLYRDRTHGLPAARMSEPKPVGGWGRTVGIYFEDCAVNYDFAVSADTPEGQVEVAKRLAAKMKFAGENLFAHPGVFYHGLIGDGYTPRTFPKDYLSAFYSVFDREGLGVMPTINCDTFPDTGCLISLDKVEDGSVHKTIFSVAADAQFPERRPLTDGPIYNIAHPDVQLRIEKYVDRLLRQGVGHPSFKGIALHLKYGSVGWFGTLETGYNDYCIDMFEKATGIRVPADRADPLRGKAYAAWLLANAREEWIRWRCSVVTGFWVRMARKIAAARPDLKLWINHITNLDARIANGAFLRDDYMMMTALEGGFDPAAFSREAPNGMLGVTHIPADYRWLTPGSRSFTAEEIEQVRKMNLTPTFWDFVRSSAYPVAHTHDRYWENACGCGRKHWSCGEGGSTLSCEWLEELGWRVGTINPGGRDALEQFAAQLRHTDLLGITKGGWMIDTYGMEDVLAPFAQAFRALPAKMMSDVPGAATGDVRVRACEHEGRRYLYAVNTGAKSASVTLRLERPMADLVTGARLPSGDAPLRLDAYELRSFGD